MQLDSKTLRRRLTASQIEEAITKGGISRKQFADMMRRKPSEVTKWLSGNHNFTIDLLSEISEVLGVQISGVPSNISSDYLSDYADVGIQEDFVKLNIAISPSTYKNLIGRANMKKTSIQELLQEIITVNAGQCLCAEDFCGIWNGEDVPDEDEIVSAIKGLRTNNRPVIL